jgi:hypothetical protein
MITGGGGFKEIIDDWSERYIEDYLQQLLEDDEGEVFEEESPIIPDAVLGHDEYRKERDAHKAQRRSSIDPKVAKTAYRFESTLDPISCHRVLLLVKDAARRGMPIASTDTFSLKYKLGIFKDDYEKLMLDGSMVKVTPQQVAHRMSLASLARYHKYKVVAWTQSGLFLFDETTLKAKTPGWVWAALGAGGGLAIGYEMWKRMKLLKYEDMRELSGTMEDFEKRLKKLEKKK